MFCKSWCSVFGLLWTIPFFCIFMKCFSSLGLIRMMIVDVELHGERMLSFEGKWCYRHSKILIDTHVPESTGWVWNWQDTTPPIICMVHCRLKYLNMAFEPCFGECCHFYRGFSDAGPQYHFLLNPQPCITKQLPVQQEYSNQALQLPQLLPLLPLDLLGMCWVEELGYSSLC